VAGTAAQTAQAPPVLVICAPRRREPRRIRLVARPDRDLTESRVPVVRRGRRRRCDPELRARLLPATRTS